VSTKQVNQLRGTPGVPLWQSNYYEHIVASERALRAIRQYIVDNPIRWHLGRYNPAATGRDPQAQALWDSLQNERRHVIDYAQQACYNPPVFAPLPSSDKPGTA